MAMSLRRSLVAALLALRAATAGGLAVAIALAFLNHTARAADEGVTITSLSQQVGETGTVTLSAVNIDVPPLGAWEIDVSFDKQVVTPAGCTPAGANSFCNQDFDDELVRLVGASPSGIRGEVVNIATVAFRCNAAGTSELTLSVNTFADTNGFQMPVSARDGSVACLASADGTSPIAPADIAEGGDSGPNITVVVIAALGILAGAVAVGGVWWRFLLTRARRRAAR